MKRLSQLIEIALILLICEFTVNHSCDETNDLVGDGTCSHTEAGQQQQAPAVNATVIHDQVLFKSVGNHSYYRCPLLTYTPGGRLLLIVDSYNGSDAGIKFIAARRSTDGIGLKWGEQAILRNDTTDGMEHNLGVVLVDDIKKEIYIFYTLCAHVPACKPGSVASVMYIKSVDDGVTWGHPVNVTAQAGPKNFAAGPGYGIQKRLNPAKGRLIVCGHGGMPGFDGVFCLLSDDHGLSWRWGAEVLPIPAYTTNLKPGDFVPDECQPAELPDGSVMLNIRNQPHYHCNCRMVMRSTDGMETINMATIYFDSALIEPGVAATILTHQGVVYYAGPASKSSRVNMILKWSFDNGTTWPGQLPIWKLGSGYSCMTAYTPDQTKDLQKYVFLAYEKGIFSSFECISLATISLDGRP